jgi:hypothetical protein
MRRAGISLLALLSIASASLLHAQSKDSNSQPKPDATPLSSSNQQKNASVPDLAVPADAASAPLPASSTSKNTSKSGAATPAQAASEDEAVAAPQQPKTEILDTSATSSALETDGHDPILDPPPFPTGMTTLVGGIISAVDRIGNHLKIKIYGGGEWTVFFDERTHVFRNGAEVTQLALKPGDRVYVDTMLDNNKRDVFARNIRLGIDAPPAETAGLIVEVDTAHGEVTMRDSINSEAVRFSVTRDTRISEGSVRLPLANLRPGSLVEVKFSPERPNRGQAREIVIRAKPGASFTFVGPVTFLDRHRQLLAVHNAADNKTYDLHIEPARMDSTPNLAVGSVVRVVAMFQPTGYIVQGINVTRAAGAPK